MGTGARPRRHGSQPGSGGRSPRRTGSRRQSSRRPSRQGEFKTHIYTQTHLTKLFLILTFGQTILSGMYNPTYTLGYQLLHKSQIFQRADP